MLNFTSNLTIIRITNINRNKLVILKIVTINKIMILTLIHSLDDDVD